MSISLTAHLVLVQILSGIHLRAEVLLLGVRINLTDARLVGDLASVLVAHLRSLKAWVRGRRATGSGIGCVAGIVGPLSGTSHV